ncbi:MAG: hypothetical protein WCJ70_00825 [bacterium]
MSDIHELPPEQVSPLRSLKVVSFLLLCTAAVAVGLFTDHKRKETSANKVLGEQVETVEGMLPQSLKNAAAKATNKQLLLDTGNNLAASTASRLSQEAEKIASNAAQGVTNFIYENTIERMIKNLILTLPRERQLQYQAPSNISSTPSP